MNQKKPTRVVKIKQRNTPEGVSKICGLQFLAEDGTEMAKIDLCEGLGQWRVQKLEKHEYIIGHRVFTPSEDDDEMAVRANEKIWQGQRNNDGID